MFLSKHCGSCELLLLFGGNASEITVRSDWSNSGPGPPAYSGLLAPYTSSSDLGLILSSSGLAALAASYAWVSHSLFPFFDIMRKTQVPETVPLFSFAPLATRGSLT